LLPGSVWCSVCSCAVIESALRSLLKTLASSFQTRLELAVTELEEEWEWQKRIFLLGLIFLFFLASGFLFLTLLVVVLIGEAYRVYALGGFAFFYLLLALLVGLVLRRKTRLKPKLFSATLSELGKDIELLKPKV